MTQREGTMLGSYRLLRLLGGGGAGEVYLAGPVGENASAGSPGARQTVAVKVLRGGAHDTIALDIVRQVRDTAEARQSHVLPVYDAGTAGDACYVAMAYAPGGSLGGAIQPGGQSAVQLPLGPGVVARIVLQVARPLRALHERGLVHGDLKPNNLFVRTAPNGGPMVAIADFGQAVVVRAAAAALASGHAGAAEALRFAAPEQLSHEALPASDQYTLAVIAYWLLTGRHPITGEGRALAETLLHSPPMPPTQVVPAIGPAIGPDAEVVLLRALAKTPTARFPDILTFARALEDGLAASAMMRAGVTQEFTALAGPSRATMPPPGASGSGARALGRDVGSSARHVSPDTRGAGSLSRGAPPAVGRRLGALAPRQRVLIGVASAVMLLVVLGAVFSLRALFGGMGTRAPLPNFGSLDYAPTVTPNVAQQQQFQAVAQAAERDLAAATAGKPQFSDALAANTNHWPVDGKQSFFGSDKRLHLSNHALQTIYSVNQPVAVPENFAISVKLTFLHGSTSDLAGLRIRVAPPGDSTSSHDLILLSPDGRYECWRFDGSHWQVMDFGYATPIKRGIGQTNTLTVLARGATIEVFVNGAYVTAVEDQLLTPVAGMAMGPTVIYAGTEVAYADYTEYALGN